MICCLAGALLASGLVARRLPAPGRIIAALAALGGFGALLALPFIHSGH